MRLRNRSLRSGTQCWQSLARSLGIPPVPMPQETGPAQLVFTSSGTEANAMVLASLLHTQTSLPRIVTTDVEHSSIV
jgi:hypothetical protein